jgi:hypothetical protein
MGSGPVRPPLLSTALNMFVEPALHRRFGTLARAADLEIERFAEAM